MFSPHNALNTAAREEGRPLRKGLSEMAEVRLRLIAHWVCTLSPMRSPEALGRVTGTVLLVPGGPRRRPGRKAMLSLPQTCSSPEAWLR